VLGFTSIADIEAIKLKALYVLTVSIVLYPCAQSLIPQILTLWANYLVLIICSWQVPGETYPLNRMAMDNISVM